MKIGFLINSMNQGGAERATASLANSFVANGHEAEIIMFKKGDSFYSLDERVQLKSINFSDTEKSFSLKRLFGTVNRMLELRKFIKGEKLDAIIGMSFSMSYYAVFTAKFTATKAIGTERSNPYVYKASRMNTVLRKLFYRLSDGYILQSEKAASFFDKGELKNGIVIPNALYNTRVYSLEPPEQREKIICTAGRLSEEKCFDMLINAFNLIKDEIPEYKLVIYGEGPEREKLESLINRLSLTERVFLPGADENAVEKVCRAGVFALTSRFEGMPNALMEAMAMGVPCVSTRCDMGPEELIDNGENGILVDVGSAEQTAEAILRIIREPELADKLSRNSIKLKESNSIDEIGRKWINYIESL